MKKFEDLNNTTQFPKSDKAVSQIFEWYIYCSFNVYGKKLNLFIRIFSS